MIHSRRLLLLLTVPALSLAACGGGSGGDSDKDKLTSIIEEGGKNPSSICSHLEASLLKQLGGDEGCKKAASSEKGDDSTEIDSLAVTGEKAVAKVHDKTGKTTINFTKVDGDWKVSASE
jgi:hypothetical protein